MAKANEPPPHSLRVLVQTEGGVGWGGGWGVGTAPGEVEVDVIIVVRRGARKENTHGSCEADE